MLNKSVEFKIGPSIPGYDGADITTVVVKINGVEYDYGSMEFIYIGSADEYIVKVNHPDWNYEQLVGVTIDAKSLIGDPMDTVSYSFTADWDPSLTLPGDPRIELFQPGKYTLQILTYQENWVRQGIARYSIPMELWYGRYQHLPKADKIELQALAGATVALGSEVLANGWLSLSVNGSSFEALDPDVPLNLGPMFANTKKDIQFKLSIPDGAQTKEYFTVQFEFLLKFIQAYGTFPFGVAIYLEGKGLVNFHPNIIIYRAYVFDSAMWGNLVETGVIVPPFERGYDKQW